MLFSYFVVASSVAMTYDWALTLGKEIELIWMQRWSHMTILYLSVRYCGILTYVANILASLPSVSLSDAGCAIIFQVQTWTNFIVLTMLDVIIIVRLYAMYQQSRKILVSLVVIFLAVTIVFGVITGKISSDGSESAEEFILSGTYMCVFSGGGSGVPILNAITWVLAIVWEVLALCLAIRIVIIHFRDLRRTSAGSPIGDCFMVLIRTHVFYFAFFAAVSCFNLGWLSPNITGSDSVADAIYYGVFQIASVVQQFVLGPRLILSVRASNAKRVANSDEGAEMSTVAFQEGIHNASTDDSV
jgi:hypothetical protein